MIIFNQEMKSNTGKLIAWIIVLTVLVGLMLAFYPFMMDDNMKSIFDNFQESLSTSLSYGFGMDESVDYTNMSEYIGFIYQYAAVLIAIFAMQLGANSLSKEQGMGNIEYIYSNPVSRSEIVTNKFLANFVTFLIFLAAMAAITFGLSHFFMGEDVRRQQLLLDIIMIFVGLIGTGLVYMALGFLISAISSNSNQADGISVLIVLISVVLIVAGKIIGDVFRTVVDLFVLEVFKPIKFVLGDFNLLGMGINLLIFILLMLLTYIIYGAKEFK